MVTKKKAYKDFTRAQAERAIQQGVAPEEFVSHSNYHVRAKAFRKMGSPFPKDAEQRAKLCADLHIKDPSLMTENVAP